MNCFVRKEDIPATLGQFIQSKWQFSNRMVRHLKSHAGCLQVNHRNETVIYELQEGDRVAIQFPPEERGARMIPQQIPFSIVYEDSDILMINKKAGISMSPSATHPSGTLANGIIYYYDKHHLPYTVHFVTRLDRDTSGLVVVAKHRYMHALLSNTLQQGQMNRLYEAIVVGRLEQTSGMINAPIGRKPGSMIERMVDPGGKEAVTHYQVIQQTASYSHVAVQLETGRTHQIRVHFAHLLCPLLGDTLYGTKKTLHTQQALHCSYVSFIHPQTKEMYQFKAPLRVDMDDFVHKQNRFS